MQGQPRDRQEGGLLTHFREHPSSVGRGAWASFAQTALSLQRSRVRHYQRTAEPCPQA